MKRKRHSTGEDHDDDDDDQELQEVYLLCICHRFHIDPRIQEDCKSWYNF